MTKKVINRDPVAQKGIYYLSLLQAVTLVIGVILILFRRPQLALILIILIYGVAILFTILLYYRFQSFSTVKRKRTLKKHIDDINFHISQEAKKLVFIQRTKQELLEKEKIEFEKTLEKFRNDYINDGL